MKNSYITHVVISSLALLSVTVFAAWWFNPSHVPSNFSGSLSFLDVILYLSVSYIIWHPIIMDVLTWSTSSHIKNLPHQEPLPGYRVAFITTIVPKSEPVELLHACLPAMVKAEYPHDTWILDEGNSPEVKKICKQYGVYHFSRHGINEYNTVHGKFAAKTKGGNHNSWYDSYGNNYDFVAQIDTDFVPTSTFLTKTLGYFRDPKIAFVGTPQIYGNTDESFIARGAAEQQYSFYGTVLRGLSGMNTTLLIGANHIIRVEALNSVDHYSAHITEDLLTGMKLHHKGWKSVYVPFPLAIGEGPTTWEAYLNQQMRWAYGCIDILFRHSPKLFFRLGFRRTIYYFFLQQHYFSGIAMALSTLLLTLYFIGGIQSADIDLLSFFTVYSFVMVVCWLMSVWLQHYHVRNQLETGMLLAGKIISIAAWPIWFLAFICVLTGKRLVYKVTPKGETDAKHSAFSPVFIPHLVFGCISAFGIITSFFTHRQNSAMLFWALISLLLMFSVPFSQNIVDFVKNIRLWFYRFAENIHDKNKSEFIDFTNHLQFSQLKDTIFDCIFLTITTTASFILYFQNLGFYSDDWSFLGNFKLSQDKSLIGLFQTATTPNTAMRPIQNFYDALLFWLFGTEPLGYHLVNSITVILIAIFLYLALKRLSLSRIMAISIALVYILLPNFSTNRFWYASFQVNISMLFYLLSLYGGLRAFSHMTKHTLSWKLISILCLLVSALSYEVILPLFVLNILLIWNPGELFRKAPAISKLIRQKPSVFISVTIITILYLLEFKLITTTRLQSSLNHTIFSYPEYVLHVLHEAFKTNYVIHILGLPKTLTVIIQQHLNIEIIVIALLLGLSIFWYLLFLVTRPKAHFPNRHWMRNLILISFIVFILGYSIFFVNNNVGFSPTGIANRIAYAAGIGVTLTVVGGFGWLLQLLLPKEGAKFFFCLLIAITCTSGFIIINTLSTFWTTAYKQQQLILTDITTHIPALYDGTTILLDGVCPYVGPASVFETEWDLKGAIQTRYFSDTVKANVITPKLKITENGITTSIYGLDQVYPFYPFGGLVIYNFQTKTVYPIKDIEAANYYFQNINPNYKYSCPPGEEGRGVELF
jgi:cellulose synthase (UDP-forming)